MSWISSDHHLAPIAEIAGKSVTAMVVVIKSADVFGVLDLNNVFTLVLTVASVIYMCFKAYNEILAVHDKRAERKAKRENSSKKFIPKVKDTEE